MPSTQHPVVTQLPQWIIDGIGRVTVAQAFARMAITVLVFDLLVIKEAFMRMLTIISIALFVLPSARIVVTQTWSTIFTGPIDDAMGSAVSTTIHCSRECGGELTTHKTRSARVLFCTTNSRQGVV